MDDIKKDDTVRIAAHGAVFIRFVDDKLAEVKWHGSDHVGTVPRELVSKNKPGRSSET